MTSYFKSIHKVIPLLAVVALVLFVYTPSIHYEFTNLDDDEYVIQNGDIRRIDLESMKHWFSKEYVLNYIPVTIASYAVDYQFSKLNPEGYRRTNIAIHCINTAVVYFLLLSMIGSLPIAVVSAFLFALHPVQIESVVWIAERKNVLSTLWMLVSFISFRQKRFWFTVISFGLAVLSKPSVVVLPLIFFAYERAFEKPFEGKRRLFVYLSTFALAFFSAAVTIGLHVTTEFQFRGGGFWSNLWVMATILFRYFAHLAYPFNLRTFYTTRVFQSVWEFPVIASLAGIFILACFFCWCWRKNPKLAFWFGWFFIFLIPVSNIFTPISTLMNDRYLYIPIIGFAAFWMSGLQIIAKKYLSSRGAKFGWRIATFIGVVLLISLVWLSVLRVKQWQHNQDLWATDQANSQFPDPRFYYNSAVTYFIQGDIQKSIEYLDKVLSFPFASEKDILMQAQNYLILQKPDDAYRYLKLIEPGRPGQLLFMYEDLMAQYHHQKGNLSEAESLYRQSVKTKPAVPTFQHLAEFLMRQGRDQEAVAVLNEGLKVDPDSRGILSQLCQYYLSTQNYERAYGFYNQLLDLYPEDPLVQKISRQMQKTQKNR